MKNIVCNEAVVARHITSADLSEGLNFYSDDRDFIQVGAWWYNEGKNLAPHIHNEVRRDINRTCETLYVISGSLEASIYDLKGELIDTFVAEAGDIVILLACGHGYRILSDGTKVLEVKNGPYPGADADRRRI